MAERTEVGKYQIISVDAPWHYANWTAKKNGAAAAHYPGMKIAELAKLPVGDLAAKNSLCLLWITGPKIMENAHTTLFDAWGFRATTILFVWVKTYREPVSIHAEKGHWGSRVSPLHGLVPPEVMTNFKGVKDIQIIPGNWCHGNGFYTSSGCEFLMLGVRGVLPRKPLLEKQILVAARGPLHSAKPNDEVRRRLKVVFPEYDSYSKIELFARPPVPPDWTALGNEIDGRDIHESLPELLETMRRVHISEEGSGQG